MPQQNQANNTWQQALLPRPRVDALLGAALQNPFVLLHAGAGFAKTTAMRQYMQTVPEGLRVVWFSFAAPDNIPARFWTHLTRVFAQHRPALGKKMEQLAFPETLQAFSQFLADLTAELYRDDLMVAFVFDDVHLLHEETVQSFLANMISSRLENSSIVLLTRTWPVFAQPLPLLAHTIGAEELRFTQKETEQLLLAADATITTAQSADIHRYVSGWPVALSLVALAIQRQGYTAGANLLSGSKPALYALFEHEIFSQYTPKEQDLLIKLSVLESFPRGLVQAVSGQPPRQLDVLLNSNIFIHYNADEMRLYFRPMYREFLQEKLQGISRQELDEALHRASDWCRENGHYYDAANYYRQCHRHEDVWNTLLCMDAGRHSKSEAEFFIEQIRALPNAFRQEHPMTNIVLAAMLVNNLHFAPAQQVLDETESRLANSQSPNTAQLLGELYIVRGFLALAMEQNGFENHFKKAAELLPQGSRRWGAGLRLVDLGPALNLHSAKTGELKKSLACYTQAAPYMAQVLHGAGQGLDALCQSETLFLTGNAKDAAAPAYQALYAGQAAAQYDIVGNALFMLLRIYTVLGNYAQLQDTLEHVERYEADSEAKNLGIWDIIRGWFYAEVGEVEQVPGWIRNPVQKGFAPLGIDRALLLRLRCLIAAGQYAEAQALLVQFEALAKSKNAIITLIYVALGRAVTFQHLGQQGDAASALKTAYTLARGNEIYMPFIEYGHRTRSLLEQVRQTGGHGMPAQWLEDMHTRASTYAKRHAAIVGRYRQQKEGALTDYHLSPREAELLMHLSQGLTREEVAQDMQLSINTVKSLTKQAFAKLGAINAADAVRIAIANQLI